KRVDHAIDLCSAIINLRESIDSYHVKSETKPHYFLIALNFVERYLYLLLFSQYILEALDILQERLKKQEEEQQKQETGENGTGIQSSVLFDTIFDKSFEEWFKARAEIQNLLANLSSN